MPSERGAALADDFGAANAEAIAFARRCGAEEWSAAVPGENWSVGVVLHHIAEGHGQTARWLRAMSRGQGVPDTAADIDRANAAHARGGVDRRGRDDRVARGERGRARGTAAPARRRRAGPGGAVRSSRRPGVPHRGAGPGRGAPHPRAPGPCPWRRAPSGLTRARGLLRRDPGVVGTDGIGGFKVTPERSDRVVTVLSMH